MVTPTELRRLALSLPETMEEDHHGIPSFRVGGKIFATVPDVEHVRVMLDLDATRAAIGEDPAACVELWWGKQLHGVSVRLARADQRRLAELLEDAWRRRAPRRLQAELYGERVESAGRLRGSRAASGKTRGGGGPSTRRTGPGR